ncbi:MAG: cold shock domain-containing protein [Hyphomicrobium sp.]|jgi:CspA family cold shock protein|uniref:cold shock domain-containing protein n=1 Tax=Hyphomicrobium sp. TaxID=82 RepID=UPI0025BB5F04|nr:cold shock domain-containing protein [Hyphomicrobium sp.]MBX9863090.1 cold shock domain-containing protein [Hyphomicrobium sp.]
MINLLTRRHVTMGLATCAAAAALPFSRWRAAGEPERPGLVRFTGRIKWYDPVKGYGFIVPDGDLVSADVLLHRVCLENSRLVEVPEGASVIAHAVRRPKGWQAFLIISLDVSTATPEASRPSRLHRRLSDIEVAELQAFGRSRLSWNG